MTLSNRLFATLRWDIIRQFRSGFYYASAFFVVVWAAIFIPIPDDVINYAIVLPALMMINMVAISFYYIGALVLLEKAEGSLTSLVVTPLRHSEYLAAKLLSLMLLALLESTLVIVLISGFGFRPWLLLAGIGLLSLLYTLAGFLTIIRYDAINTFLLPSVLVIVALVLPLISYLNIWTTSLFYLHPLQPALTLLRAAFQPAAGWEIIYGLLGSFFWLGLGFGWAKKRFKQFAIQQGSGFSA